MTEVVDAQPSGAMMTIGKAVLLWARPTAVLVTLYYTAVAVMSIAGWRPSILGIPLDEAPVWMLLTVAGGGLSYARWVTLTLGGGPDWWVRD